MNEKWNMDELNNMFYHGFLAGVLRISLYKKDSNTLIKTYITL